MKKVTSTTLAFLTSGLILLSVIYNVSTNQPLYSFTSFLHHATIIVSIITIGIHYNALKENNEKRTLLLGSLAVPIAVILYFTFGIIYIYIRSDF